MKYVPPPDGGADGPYVDARPEAGLDGSIVPAAAIEHVQREIVNAIAAAGLTPSAETLDQLAQAIVALAGTSGAFVKKAGDIMTGPLTTDGLRINKSVALDAGHDLDTLTRGGFYAVFAPANGPLPDAIWYYVQVQRHAHSVSYVLQNAWLLSADGGVQAAYTRIRWNDMWQPWLRYQVGALPSASETQAGIVELATEAEAKTGTDTVRAVTSKGVREAFGQFGLGSASLVAATRDYNALVEGGLYYNYGNSPNQPPGVNGSCFVLHSRYESAAGGHAAQYAMSNDQRVVVRNQVDGVWQPWRELWSGGRAVQSFGTSGYQRLPSGLILQWGTRGGGQSSVTFPIAYPTTCTAVLVTDAGSAAAYGVVNRTATGFDILSADTNYTCNWLAVGF